MRTDKLVGMIKEIARNKLEESYGQRYKGRTKTYLLPTGRYGSSVKLAEEEPDEKNTGKTMTGQPADFINDEPEVKSIKQDR